jgi:hypothetical protein
VIKVRAVILVVVFGFVLFFQKNPQVMYLEQELESLKAVLEIKNEKLHQQDMKLMKMEKLVCLLQDGSERLPHMCLLRMCCLHSCAYGVACEIE